MRQINLRRGLFSRPALGALSLSLSLSLVLSGAALAQAVSTTLKSHAVTIRSTPKYPPDFSHFDYANPNAPKGGAVKLAVDGTFDSLNPFILKGNSAAGISSTFETLTDSALDEPNTDYGLIAHTIETPPDVSWVAFHLRREARFHDGSPISPDDVIFSFNILKEKGRPFYRAYYKDVVAAERFGEWGVKFTFGSGTNQELPAILGQLPILSKAYFEAHPFDKTSLDPILGSGPYRVESVDAGRSIVYRRVENHWAENLPVRKGHNNFDEIRMDYYRDSTVMLEALKAGEFDFRNENNSKLWATGYESPALKAGNIVKALIPHERPAGMQGFIYNTRRELFKDARVRQALAYAFDFEWTNANLFYGQYKRSNSFFTNSELAARALPSVEELALLEPHRANLPPEVFTTIYEPPRTGEAGVRGNLRTAIDLLKSAGWVIKNKRLTHSETGQVFDFEMLLRSPAFERVVLPFKKNLERLGIDMSVRTIDTAQYAKRVEEFDFDMVLQGFGQSLSPGNEQRDFWHSASADVPGSRNIIGVKDPAVDELIDLIISAPDRASLVHRTRALDRVLLWSHYVIPNWHINAFRVAYWDKFDRPAKSPKYGLGFNTWWVNSTRAPAIAAAQGRRTAK
ncbi:MAG: microcin C transport system substrate-binding protein [Gammaproteobacteria bacterium]|jgi:microcin C transport system substrate-binding protein